MMHTSMKRPTWRLIQTLKTRCDVVNSDLVLSIGGSMARRKNGHWACDIPAFDAARSQC